MIVMHKICAIHILGHVQRVSGLNVEVDWMSNAENRPFDIQSTSSFDIQSVCRTECRILNLFLYFLYWLGIWDHVYSFILYWTEYRTFVFCIRHSVHIDINFSAYSGCGSRVPWPLWKCDPCPWHLTGLINKTRVWAGCSETTIIYSFCYFTSKFCRF